MGLKYKTAPLSPRIGAEWPKIIENIIFHVFHSKYTKICPKIYRILIWPFWRHFWPKTPILTTFATEFFLATWKFGIYVKKHGRNRRQMVVLGGGGAGTSWAPDLFAFILYKALHNKRVYKSLIVFWLICKLTSTCYYSAKAPDKICF